MSKPFEWRDFTKKYNDLSTNNFPVLSKANQVQDTTKFKFSSKAQKGVKFDSSVTNYDAKTTEADFSTKLNLNEVNGLELGFKAKTKGPSTEFTAKFDDKIVPVEGASVTIKAAATGPSEQTIGATFGYGNKFVNLNLGFSYPLAYKLFDFVKEETLDKQKPKVDIDFVTKPLEGHDIFFGGNANITLPGEHEELLYNSKFSLALNNKTFNGGVFVEHKKELQEDKYSHNTKFGGWAYTEEGNLSGGAQIAYSPTDKGKTYKGFSFEAVSALQNSEDSKLSGKVQVIPDTIASLGYEHKLSPAAKIFLGYSFLLNKPESKKASAYYFGLELSH